MGTRSNQPVASSLHDKELYQELKEMLFHYSGIQVESDSIYQSRTNTITITQGLLFVAVNSLSTLISGNPNWKFALTALAILGALLSLFWLLYEQRNLRFFKARAMIIRDLEKQIAELALKLGFSFPEFWNKVPRDVQKSARWFERFSAQQVVRFWVPSVFVLAWISVIIAANWNVITAALGAIFGLWLTDPFLESLGLTVG